MRKNVEGHILTFKIINSGINVQQYLKGFIVVGSLVMLACRLVELICCKERINDDEIYFLKPRR
jgi:hypothetical protein